MLPAQLMQPGRDDGPRRSISMVRHRDRRRPRPDDTLGVPTQVIVYAGECRVLSRPSSIGEFELP